MNRREYLATTATSILPLTTFRHLPGGTTPDDSAGPPQPLDAVLDLKPRLLERDYRIDEEPIETVTRHIAGHDAVRFERTQLGGLRQPATPRESDLLFAAGRLLALETEDGEWQPVTPARLGRFHDAIIDAHERHEGDPLGLTAATERTTTRHDGFRRSSIWQRVDPMENPDEPIDDVRMAFLNIRQTTPRGFIAVKASEYGVEDSDRFRGRVHRLVDAAHDALAGLARTPPAQRRPDP